MRGPDDKGLPGMEISIGNDLRYPRHTLLTIDPELDQSILEQPFRLVRQAGLRLLGIGESPGAVTIECESSIGALGSQQSCWSAAHHTQWFAGINGCGEQSARHVVDGKVFHRPVSTGVQTRPQSRQGSQNPEKSDF